MLALEAKRGVEATLERVYKATHNDFDKLVVAWCGTTAGIKTEGDTTYIMFPGIDETKHVEQSMFNELIGYALHELGHKWFTQDRPWDNARKEHGAYVSALINGLEDPRIEMRVINSGYAPNARSLFEFLVNQVLRKGGYVEPDDFKNFPFLLAIEGRRLNGYDICVPSVLAKSPYAADLRWALRSAQKAQDTKRIVKIAIELYERLKQRREELKQQPEQGDGKSNDKPGDKSQPGQPGQPGEQGQPGDGQGDDANSEGSEASQNGAGDANDDGEGEGQGQGANGSSDEVDDEPSDKPSQSGGGHGNTPDEPVGRNPEPTDFINDECASIKSDADERRMRPHVGKPIYAEFNFR